VAAISEPALVVSSARARERALWSWLTTVDHKRIGLMYLLSGAFFFVVGGVEAVLIRIQLAGPNGHFVSPAVFNELFTMHGTTMIFLAAMPILIGFINFVVPLQIGARDVAFPRMNALSFWLFLFGALFLNSSWFLGGAPNAGWFNYAPISVNAYNPGPGIDFYDLGLQLAGIGSLMTAVNFLVTIINMRAPGMTLMRMPLFCWATFVMMLLILFAFPPLTVNFFLLMFDRLLGTNFFNVAHGGNVLIWQHLFWIFGHPEVYILILPAFGMISEVVPTYVRKTLFGYESMVLALVVIAFLSFMVWTHHMFAVGLGPVVNSIFAATSMLIAVPTGVKIFNWLATMWGGRIRFTTAMLWVLGFIPTFVLGGVSGVMLAMAPADFQYNDSYFVVAHFHYVIIGGVVFGALAGLFHWFPKMSGRLLDERLGKISFWLTLVGFNVTFVPMHFHGLYGMPRRIATYPAGLGWHLWNLVSTLGVIPLAMGVLLVAANVVVSSLAGERAAAYNFATLPLVRARDAYHYEKVSGNGHLLPAEPPGPIHLPSGSLFPLLVAAAATLAAYGAVFHSLPVVILGLLTAFYCLYRLLVDEDPGRLVLPHGEVQEEAQAL
jgi:cytochrome c oxidase subunit 1